jgi:hypothetical protein
VVGGTTSTGAGSWDALVARLDDSEEIVWSTTLGTTGFDEAAGVALAADGGFAVSGFYRDGTDGAQGFLARYDALNALVWEHDYGSSKQDRFYRVHSTRDGRWLVAGVRDLDPANNVGTAWVVCADDDGSILWEATLVTGSRTAAYEAVELEDGRIAVTGYTAGAVEYYDGFLGWLSDDGRVLDQRLIDDAILLSLAPLSDGGIAFAGSDGASLLIGRADAWGDLSCAEAGVCSELPANVCDDADSSSIDWCDPAGGCSHEAAP